MPDDGQFIASHIQIDELNRTKDVERRAKLFLMFAKTVREIAPTESFILGNSRLDEGKLSDGNLYSLIKHQLDKANGEKENNIHDALITEVAIKNQYTLLTTDYDLSEVAKNNGCNVMYWKT